MAGCTALCILGCSADEYDDFGDDEIYTLSKPKKTREVETCYSIWGDPQDGHVLKQNERQFSDCFIGEASNGESYLYNFTVKYTGQIIGYMDSTTNITHYNGAILSWKDVEDDRFSAQITSMSSNSITFKVTFGNNSTIFGESSHCMFL